jgi:translocation and assembly module TamB
VSVQINDATLAPMAGIEFPGTTASVRATFDDDRATLEASLRIDDHAKPGEDPATACEGTIAEVRISEADALLRGPLLAPSTWTKLSGRARVDAKDTRLDCIAKRLPLALLLTEVAGRLDASVSVERPVGQRFVSVKTLEVRTRGLKIAGPQPFGSDKPLWESRSMDIGIAGSVDGASGATAIRIEVLDDTLLGELDTHVTLDLRTLIDDPKRRLDSIAKSAGTVTFKVPRRTLQSLKCLPSVLRDKLPPIDGSFSVTATASGTLQDPTLSARVSGWQLAHVDADHRPTEWSLPVDLDVVANYQAKKAGLVAQIRRHDREIASIVGKTDVDLPALAGGVEAAPNFEVQTTLTRLPLGRLPYFVSRGLEASVSGTLLLAQHGDIRTAKARFAVPALRINREMTLQTAALELDIEPSTDGGQGSHGSFKIDVAGRDGGHLEAAGYSGVNWSEVVPQVDEQRPAGLSIRSRAFELSSLQPFVNGVFSRIGGKLEGEFHVVSTMLGDGSRGHIESNMELTDGIVHIPQIGQELKNAHLSIRSRELGSLHFEDIRAEGISGRIHGSAIAKMSGLSFQSATADFKIDKSEPLPITFEGVPLGQAYGNLTIVADKQPQEVDIFIKVPALHLALPAASTRAVQPLDAHPDIAISHAVGPEKEARQSDALAWITTIELGTVQIEGMGVDVKLTSPKGAGPRIELREEARMSGDVKVIKGTFEVIGKKFEIERGLVRLRPEDGGNPYVNITARWDAPNGTRVYVDYAGVLKPITEQKLRFRSDPALPQQAILAMVLSGGSSSSDDTTQGSSSAADVAANVVGGEIASTQINAVLSQIAPLRGLSTRLGTSDSGQLRTTVMYELSDTVKAQASYEGLPNGSRLDGTTTTASDAAGSTNRTEINIDWRFYNNWLLRGSFGFGGVNQQPSSGLDMLWQYRY